VQPLDLDGRPARTARSSCSRRYEQHRPGVAGLQRLLAADTERNPRLASQRRPGRHDAAATQDPNDGRTGTRYWTVVDENSRPQASPVPSEAVWIKQADAGPIQGFPGYAKTLQGELARIVQLLPGRFRTSSSFTCRADLRRFR